jgi:methylmalonyl-CoA mutase N-terminal domain/subunit
VNTVDDLAECLQGMALDRTSLSLGDNAPFTLSAMLLELARRQGIDWTRLTGTTNQSDYLSLAAANHMFFRLSLDASRRLLIDHIKFMNARARRWNPLSVVGQHMQEAGATPAEAMAFALSSAIQYARDLASAGLVPDSFLPRFSFFFDVSLSFFEEIAKFRAGRRLWARITREQLGARQSASWRMRFHAQTAGVELTASSP